MAVQENKTTGKYRAVCHAEQTVDGKKQVHNWKGRERDTEDEAFKDYLKHVKGAAHTATPFEPYESKEGKYYVVEIDAVPRKGDRSDQKPRYRVVARNLDYAAATRKARQSNRYSIKKMK